MAQRVDGAAARVLSLIKPHSARYEKTCDYISGAISLGSYEAEVMYEVIRAIKEHNLNSETPDAEQIRVDAVAGASAGGMTATLLAQSLLFRGGRLERPYDNILYDAWVRDIDLADLLRLEAGEKPEMSICSSKLIEALARKHITDHYTQSESAPKHPAVAERIHLGMALSNLTGIDYGIPLEGGEQFKYTRFQDEFKEEIDSTVPTYNALGFWEPIRDIAASCGAFPFAFRVKALNRLPQQFPPMPIEFPPAKDWYGYVDGGTFQNEPLGLSKGMVNRIDHHLNQDSRFYLYVDPTLRRSALPTQTTEAFYAADATLLGLLGISAGTYVGFKIPEKKRETVSPSANRTELMAASESGFFERFQKSSL